MGTQKRQTENSANSRILGFRTSLMPRSGDAQNPRIWPLRAVRCELTGREFPNENEWLPGMDSNHELDRFFGLFNLLILQGSRSRKKPQKQGRGTKSVQNLPRARDGVD